MGKTHQRLRHRADHVAHHVLHRVAEADAGGGLREADAIAVDVLLRLDEVVDPLAVEGGDVGVEDFGPGPVVGDRGLGLHVGVEGGEAVLGAQRAGKAAAIASDSSSISSSTSGATRHLRPAAATVGADASTSWRTSRCRSGGA